MNYTLHVTRHAFHDLEDAADYIEYNLFDRKSADRLLDEFEESVGKLNTFPEKHALSNDPVLRNWGVRYYTLRNYLVFYVVRDGTIYVTRFLHEKRDWQTLLRTEGINLD